MLSNIDFYRIAKWSSNKKKYIKKICERKTQQSNRNKKIFERKKSVSYWLEKRNAISHEYYWISQHKNETMTTSTMMATMRVLLLHQFQVYRWTRAVLFLYVFFFCFVFFIQNVNIILANKTRTVESNTANLYKTITIKRILVMLSFFIPSIVGSMLPTFYVYISPSRQWIPYRNAMFYTNKNQNAKKIEARIFFSCACKNDEENACKRKIKNKSINKYDVIRVIHTNRDKIKTENFNEIRCQR